MNINNTISQNNFSFGAKVSPEFVNAMRQFYNNGENRLKSQYKLDRKLEQIHKFGKNTYTIELTKKYAEYGTEYTLLAVKDGQQAKDGAVLAKRNSFRYIINAFMEMNKKDFYSKLTK